MQEWFDLSLKETRNYENVTFTGYNQGDDSFWLYMKKPDTTFRIAFYADYADHIRKLTYSYPGRTYTLTAEDNSSKAGKIWRIRTMRDSDGNQYVNRRQSLLAKRKDLLTRDGVFFLVMYLLLAVFFALQIFAGRNAKKYKKLASFLFRKGDLKK